VYRIASILVKRYDKVKRKLLIRKKKSFKKGEKPCGNSLQPGIKGRARVAETLLLKQNGHAARIGPERPAYGGPMEPVAAGKPDG